MEMTEDITEAMTTNLNLMLAPEDVPEDIRNSLPRYTVIYIFHVIIGITGVLGNGFVLIVLLNTRDMWDATNLLIANQSLIDFFGSLSVIVFDVVSVPSFETAGPALARYLYFFWYTHYFVWSLNYASIFNLVFISFERFYAVRYPIRYRSKITVKPAIVASTLAWIAGLGWSWFLPASSRLENGICRRPVWPTEDTAAVVSGLTILVLYVFPLIIMITIYTYIGHVLKRGSATRRFQDQGAGPQAGAAGSYREIARRKVMTTMIIVTVTSLLCWTPSNLLYVSYAFGANINLTGIENATVQCIHFANSCINPFIYTFKYQKFQDGLRRLLRLRDSKFPTGAEKVDVKTNTTNLA
ncbi:galanin receptor type 2-like [Strongylocentrotus purpuratus]|uniref:G-protein coupled receptors family 1 profile domain-containing protein n=1 Tax=Strongylocentrotus purpuratus TaxID=7668 RepID=A0A7M7RGP3_STRPU|nr:galanin receptor type 2-like [Strongylocentrotus purpuratus]